jgi:pimeloyl-ACP methyl ester carboxylesterase
MKKRSFIFAFAIGVAGCFADLHGQTGGVAVPSGSAQGAITQPAVLRLPVPSGPFGIGRVGYEWIDNARPDAYSTDPKANRALMVYFWYPTPQSTAGVAESYLPGAKQMDADPDVRHQMTDEFGALWPLIVAGSVKSHAIENAPVTDTPRQFPLVLFSHGSGSTGFEYTSLIEDLVSRGYVVAAIEHTYTAAAVTFPDGRMVPAHHDSVPDGLSPEQRWKRMMDSAALGIRQGAEDLTFVLNRLIELNNNRGQSFLLEGRLDLNRVAAVGHSAGGAFATGACQLDARFHACVSLDGEMPPVMAFPEFPESKGFRQPVLLLEVDHTGDRMPFSAAQFGDFRKKVEAQLNLCPKGSYDVLLKAPGLFHGSFSDYPLRAANGDAVQSEVAIHNLRLTQSYTRAFLDKYLRDQTEPLLDEPAQSSEAVVKAYGH